MGVRSTSTSTSSADCSAESANTITTSSTACDACDALLEEALALDRGPFMDGFSLRDSEPFDEWQVAEAEAYRRDVAAVLERLARSQLAARRWDRAVLAGRRWLDLDPLHEPAHRLLMSAYAAAGEDAAAVRQYRDCVRVLEAELGVAPLEETTDLYETIRTGSFRPPAGDHRCTSPTIAAPTAVGWVEWPHGSPSGRADGRTRRGARIAARRRAGDRRRRPGPGHRGRARDRQDAPRSRARRPPGRPTAQWSSKPVRTQAKRRFPTPRWPSSSGPGLPARTPRRAWPRSGRSSSPRLPACFRSPASARPTEA